MSASTFARRRPPIRNYVQRPAGGGEQAATGVGRKSGLIFQENATTEDRVTVTGEGRITANGVARRVAGTDDV